jgi:DNA-binding CsgD family transcriptional regulator
MTLSAQTSTARLTKTANPVNILSGDALIGFDRDLRIVLWNDAAEKLTGITTAEAVGRCCWELVRGRADDGSRFCGPECELARLTRGGQAVPCCRVLIDASAGPRAVSMSTLTVTGAEPLFLHVIASPEPLPQHASSSESRPHLTDREQEVLERIADGVPAKVIALRLGISVSTVRNHIRSILSKLHAQSQLQALARARSLGLV